MGVRIMGSQEITPNPGFYISLGVQALLTLVLLGLVIVGIIVAVRAKTGTRRGCGIVMAVAFALQSCLAAFWFLISFFAALESNSSAGTGQTQTIAADYFAAARVAANKSLSILPPLWMRATRRPCIRDRSCKRAARGAAAAPSATLWVSAKR